VDHTLSRSEAARRHPRYKLLIDDAINEKITGSCSCRQLKIVRSRRGGRPWIYRWRDRGGRGNTMIPGP